MALAQNPSTCPASNARAAKTPKETSRDLAPGSSTICKSRAGSMPAPLSILFSAKSGPSAAVRRNPRSALKSPRLAGKSALTVTSHGVPCDKAAMIFTPCQSGNSVKTSCTEPAIITSALPSRKAFVAPIIAASSIRVSKPSTLKYPNSSAASAGKQVLLTKSTAAMRNRTGSSKPKTEIRLCGIQRICSNVIGSSGWWEFLVRAIGEIIKKGVAHGNDRLGANWHSLTGNP